MTSNNHPTATFSTPHSNFGQRGRFGSEQVAAFIGMLNTAMTPKLLLLNIGILHRQGIHLTLLLCYPRMRGCVSQTIMKSVAIDLIERLRVRLAFSFLKTTQPRLRGHIFK
jgi:hypothetical protein